MKKMNLIYLKKYRYYIINFNLKINKFLKKIKKKIFMGIGDWELGIGN